MILYLKHLLYALVRALARVHHGLFPEEEHLRCHAEELSLPLPELLSRAWAKK